MAHVLMSYTECVQHAIKLAAFLVTLGLFLRAGALDADLAAEGLL